MKNIHLLPTEKRSRLYIYNGKLGFAKGFQYGTDTILNQHIYITSDVEIKEGFVLHLYTNRILEVGVITESNGNKSFREKNYHINGIEVLICDCKKIILTTDQDLIKDGVQEIDDEFLEWFVKNPSCDEIEVNWVKTPDGIFYHKDNIPYGCYKIITPKEKMQTVTELESWTVTWYVKTGWSDSTRRQAKVFIKKEDAKEFERQLIEQAKFIGCWISTDLTKN